jgi:hypothetical protein
MKSGWLVRVDDQPRLFRFFLALRGSTAVLLAGLAAASALGWVHFNSN